jgi:hypothetical protein
MSFFELLRICQDIITNLLVSVPDVLSTFTDSLGDGIMYDLQIFWDFPLIGSALETIAQSLLNPLQNVSLLTFMFGVLIPTMIVYSFTKWLVGIVTGS